MFGWRSSLDGSVWSGFNDTSLDVSDATVSAFCDVATVHVASKSNPSTSNLNYRKGTLETDGLITWDAAAQTALTGLDVSTTNVNVIQDTNGFPWIQWTQQFGGPFFQIRVIKSSLTTGVWSTEFVANLTSGGTQKGGTITPLTDGKVAVVYGEDITPTYPRLRFSTGNVTFSAFVNASILVERDSKISIVANGDDVDVLLQDTNQDIYLLPYTFASDSFGTPVLVESTTELVSTINPVLVGFEGDLIAMWPRTNLNVPKDHLYYKQRIGGTWDTDPTNMTASEDEHLGATGGFFPLSAITNVVDGEFFLIYKSGTVGDQPLKFARVLLAVGGPLSVSEPLSLDESLEVTCISCIPSFIPPPTGTILSTVVAQFAAFAGLFLPSLLIIIGILTAFLRAGLSGTAIPVAIIFAIALVTAIGPNQGGIPLWLGIMGIALIGSFMLVGRQIHD